MTVTHKEIKLIRELLKKSNVDNAEVKTNNEGNEIFIKTDKKNSLVVLTIANTFTSITKIKVNVEFTDTEVWSTTLDDGKSFYVKYAMNMVLGEREYLYSDDGFYWTTIKPKYLQALSNAYKFFKEVSV